MQGKLVVLLDFCVSVSAASLNELIIVFTVLESNFQTYCTVAGLVQYQP